MIRHAEQETRFADILTEMAADNPFVCRILSLYNSYPPHLVFVDYWLVLSDAGACTGAIARSGTAFVLYLTGETDLDEVSAFMRVAGASEILCDGAFPLTLHHAQETRGVVLVRRDPIKGERGALLSPDLRAFYALLTACAGEGFTPPAFEDFYVDVNHKLRHNACRLCGIEVDGALAAAAMTVAESDRAAVLGAVACDPQYRRKGLGSAVVRGLTDALIGEGKSVYLHRAQNANAAFYEALGFEKCGEWREYRLA